MIYIALAFMYVGGFSAATYLVINNHPWFALLAFLITASLHTESKRI